MGKRGIPTLLTILTIMMILSGCNSNRSELNCPFTELSWDSTAKEMIASEGKGYDTYDSIYNGLTYTYPKEYLGNPGIIKYMYDDRGKLCNISWSYTGDTADSVLTVYRNVVDEMNRLHGESRNDDGVGNYGEVWVSGSGTVMANAVITNDVTVMQIAYMNPEVSKQSN